MCHESQPRHGYLNHVRQVLRQQVVLGDYEGLLLSLARVAGNHRQSPIPHRLGFRLAQLVALKLQERGVARVHDELGWDEHGIERVTAR